MGDPFRTKGLHIPHIKSESPTLKPFEKRTGDKYKQ